MTDNSNFSAYNHPTTYKSQRSFQSDRDSSRTTPTRPKIAREGSDFLPSYYESSIPNETQAKLYARPPTTSDRVHNRKASTTSITSSDSEYSYDSETTDARGTVSSSETSSSLTRRSSAPSKGGADRRRVAIVQMDSVRETGTPRTSSETTSSYGTGASSIRSRRGLDSQLAGLALVAPPDAALRTFTHLTPPSTAPITADCTAHPDKQGHYRSASENPPGSSRDTVSVGTLQGNGSTSHLSLSSNNTTGVSTTKGTRPEDKATRYRKNALRAESESASCLTTATFLSSSSLSSTQDQSKSKTDRNGRSGLLSPPDTAYPSALAIDMFSPIITPEIGESKEIHMPVAGPVVVNLDGLQSRKAGTWRSDSPGAVSSHSRGTSNNSYASSAVSSYLRYEPGVHATAGPLPPPPRAMFNIDISTPPPPRPPRLNSPVPPRAAARSDIESIKQALQLPPSVTAALAKRKSVADLSNNVKSTISSHDEKDKYDDRDCRIDVEIKADDCSSHLSHSPSVHRREGATDVPSIHLSESSSSPSSTESSSSSLPTSESAEPVKLEDLEPSTDKTSTSPVPEEQLAEDKDDYVPSMTVIAETTPRSQSPDRIDHKKFDQWLKENPLIAQPFNEARRAEALRRDSSEQQRRSMSPLSPDVTGEAPSPPPKSLRNSLTQNLKRFSALPRTPSLSSRSSRLSSGSTRYSSRTPSPSLHRPIQHAPFKKIIATDPAALFCHEVHRQTTTLQRCAIYADKINELYIHDCGLSEWVMETKTRGPNTHANRGPSARPFVTQPRQSSRSSTFSEVTFAIRPDATVATDLSQGAHGDITPATVASTLPYPSLALNPLRSNTQPARSNSSVGSGTPPSIRSLVSTPSTKSTGFFASLGRKASLSTKRDRDRFPPPGSLNSHSSSSSSGLMSPVSARLANKSNNNGINPAVLNISRPINITNPPSVPGGPRAPPYRAQRSQTYTSTFLPNTTPEIDRDQAVGRRPSLFNITSDTVIDIQADPAFTRQVDQLAAVLPHADRDILAGYLRRAGQDMLAIGQYLEDERMGTIRRP